MQVRLAGMSRRSKRLKKVALENNNGCLSSLKGSNPGRVVVPENWKVVYDKIAEFRKERIAPVDYAGCARIPRREFSEKVF